MKKICFVVVLAFCTSVIFAQTKRGGILNVHNSINKIEINKSKSTKSLNDTLMWFDGKSFSVNSTDAPSFNFIDSNMDANTDSTTNGYPLNWFSVYSTNSWDLQPTDVDTAFYIGATSWFDNDPAQSKDWFNFGPLTLPTGTNSAVVNWLVKTNPAYRDGYKVLVSSTGINPADFTNTPIYTRADSNTNDATDNVDTIFHRFSANIPASFNGGHVYVAFYHDATGMDCLWLDDIRVIAENSSGINNVEKNNFILYQNQPNPATSTTMVQYEVQNNSNVSLQVFDITGRLVLTMDEGNQIAGMHSILIDAGKLQSGTYFYLLKAGDNRLTKKMVIE